jgi:putative ABC transport system permease protein
MRSATLIRRSLVHYWRTNAAVVAGVGVAVAVLAGALLVGDSVRGSLRSLFLGRVGQTGRLVTAEGFFRERLAEEFDARAFEAAGAVGAGVAADGGAAAGRAAGGGAACPLVVLKGAVAHDASGRRASGVQVYGVDARFWKFHGLEGRVAEPSGGELLISPSLARELGAAAGDSLRVRVEKPSAIPVESLHGRKEDVGRTVRLTAREVLPAERLGEFSLRPQQGEVRAVFVPLSRLQKEIGREGRVNALLLRADAGDGQEGDEEEADGARAVAAAERVLREAATLEDLGLDVRALEDQNCLSLESESALLTEEIASAARTAGQASGLRPVRVFSYLANTIRAGGREIPYSLVTAIEGETFEELKGRPAGEARAQEATAQVTAAREATARDAATDDGRAGTASPIVLNEWAARDLGAKPGDRVTLEYFLWREEGRLVTESAEFTLAGVAPIDGIAADRNLTPEYPGISDTESLSDWDPPFPVDLARVRPQDDEYWKQFRTTPKAFIPLARGQELWRTRFGTLTSLRLYTAARVASLEESRADFGRRLRAQLDPLRAGFSVFDVRGDGLRASRGATDFGEYFLYFSFFIVVSALLLASLFFKLGVEQRVREIGLLRAVGFPEARTRRLFLSEGLALALAGSAVGVCGALLYAGLMMWGLRTWWVDAVGTRSLALQVSTASLAAGAAGGVAAALACVWWTLRSLRRVSARGLLAGNVEEGLGSRGWGSGKKGEGGRGKGKEGKGEEGKKEEGEREEGRGVGRRPLSLFFAFVLGALGFVMLGLSAAKVIGETAGFFGAGVALLCASLCGVAWWLRRGGGGVICGRGAWPVARLGFRSATHRPGRSVLCVALVASAAFIIVAVDAFRQEGRGADADRKSGAGGYALLAESLLPVAHDPNSDEGREALSLGASAESRELSGVSLARFRLRPGDDASCLNLYQPRRPRILAAAPGFVRENRFGFQDSLAATEEERANPWLLLERDAGDGGAIPVAADAKSLAYVLHKKLGDEIEVAGGGGEALRLRVVAALSDSLFQSELLMSERNFLRAFPEQQGYRYFLIDAPAARAPAVAALLEDRLSDFGFDAVSTSERLAAYHRVENTYLSTFQTLGGLGLALGTLGLAAVLLRNVFERRKELALLRAVGYGRREFALMVLAENALLLLAGLAAGAACALVAIAPAFLARSSGRLPHLSLGLLLLAVLAAGLAASLAATVAALRSPLLPALRAE